MVGAGIRGLGQAWSRLSCTLANGWRRIRRKQLPDYVVIVLDHAVSERAPSVPWYYAYLPGIKLPLSLEYLYTALERIAGDPDVRGVVFLIKGPSLSLSKAQSATQLFERFRQWDATHRATTDAPPKQIVVHLEDAGAAALVLAAAADKISMTPLSTWGFAGLRIAPLYIKETLARIGVVMDVAQIAPWKSAFDAWQHSRMSPEARDQYNWLLDSLFEDIIHAIAQGRNLVPATVRALVDRAPLPAPDALAAGLVDALLYEDELAGWLSPADTTDQPARLARYAQTRGLLLRRFRARHAQTIGILTLEGTITPGPSRQFPIPLPLVGDRFIGSQTVAYQVRAARKNRRLAAVVLHVDSGGGSALASDLIWRELRLLAQEKPLIVYMGDKAASGGYYIAAPGHKIVAQSATLTGSIGVIIAKLVTGGATALLHAHREVIQRGENAGINAEDNLWTPEERAQVFASLHHVYDTFKDRVSQGRNLPLEGLDAVANGRVWTGKQALERGLVDALGDIQVAIDLACREAGLPQDGSVATLDISSVRSRELAFPLAQNGSTNAPAFWGDALYERPASPALADDLLPLARTLLAGNWEELVGRDRFWFWADGLPRLDR
jgi:protease-4